ncbi:MAG: right-handed parallel beta-helix repeat-containing protein [Flavobacteriaceae bacterium]|nr:right-handed parallel beta-helix repeat-containing protein [Flavobacteriaceae bacterium]
MKKPALFIIILLALLTLNFRFFAQSSTYYVATDGNDSNDGLSLSTPFKTILKASQEADTPGDIVEIRGGVYREGNISHQYSGNADSYITFKSHNNEEVIIKGSNIYENFTVHPTNSNIWKVEGVDFNAQQIFSNGEMLRKIGYPNFRVDDVNNPNYEFSHVIYYPLNECSEMPFGLCEGTFYFDEIEKELWVWFPNNLNPNQGVIEISNKRWIWRNIIGEYIKLEGLNFMHTNVLGSLEPPANITPVVQGSAVTLGKFGVVDNCTFSYCDFGGLHFNKKTTDQIGGDFGQVVKNSTFHHNGAVGFSANQVGGILVEDNVFYENSYRPFVTIWASAAMKFIPNVWGEIKNNTITNSYGHAIWFDWCTTENEILVHNNYIENAGIPLNHPRITGKESGQGVFIEITGNAKVYNNIIINAYHRGVYLSTAWNAKVANNLIYKTKNRGQIGLSYKRRTRDWPDDGQGAITYYLQNNEIYNNILFNKEGSIDIEVIGNNNDLIYDPSWNNVFNNNLIYNDNDSYLYKHLGYPVDSENNGDYYNLTDWFNATSNDQISIEGQNPNFNFSGSPTGQNYWSIQITSPALDKGKFLSYVPNDYVNTSRTQKEHDIGPYEYNYELLNLDDNTIAKTELILFPNPAKNAIIIRSSNQLDSIIKISIIDIKGNVILNFNQDFNQKLDISSVSSGMYFVKVYFEHKKPTIKKLIIY